MALTSYTAGEVLTAASLNANFTFAAANPPAAAGLTLIATATPAAVDSISVNNCFTSTYENYRIHINYSSSVGANAMTTMRLRVAGTDSTTGYKSMQVGYGAGAATSAADISGTNDWYVSYLDPTGNGNIVTIDIFNPFSAARTNMIGANGYASSVPNYYMQLNYSTNTASTSYDGFTILTSGTSFTGNIRVYGYANS